MAVTHNWLQIHHFNADGRDKSPFLESLVRENIVGEQQRFECQVGEALPQAEIVWQTNSGTGNQWINVSADDQLKNYSFQTRVCKIYLLFEFKQDRIKAFTYIL